LFCKALANVKPYKTSLTRHCKTTHHIWKVGL